MIESELITWNFIWNYFWYLSVTTWEKGSEMLLLWQL